MSIKSPVWCPFWSPFCRQTFLFLLWTGGAMLGLCGAEAQVASPFPPSALAPAPTPSHDESTPSQAESVASDQSLSEDAGLNRPISLEELGVPLSELLQGVSGSASEGGPRLTCGSSCADLKLQIRLKQRPLRALMKALAEMLPGTWHHDGKNYRLEMDSKAVGRRDRWWQLFLGERERALEAQRALVLARMRSQPPVSTTFDSSEIKNQSRNDQKLFRDLPASLQEQIASQMDDTSFYETGLISYQGDPDTPGTVVVRLTDMPTELQQSVKEEGLRYRSSVDNVADINNAFVTFCNGGIAVQANLVFPDNTIHSTMVASLVVNPFDPSSPNPFGPVLTPNHDQLPGTVRRLGKDTPWQWKALAEYQESRAWPNDPPSRKRPYSIPPPRRAEVLEWLGDKANLEFVADYYSRQGQPFYTRPQQRPLSGSLKQELDWRAAEQDMSWKRRDDGVYLFRDNRWYRDDRLEVPASLLRRWFAWHDALLESLVAAGRGIQTAPLVPVRRPVADPNPSAFDPFHLSPERSRAIADWQAEVVTELTPWQIMNGLQWAVPETPARPGEAPPRKSNTLTQAPLLPRPGPPFEFDGEIIMKGYKPLLFYAGLDGVSRSALCEGRLSYAALNPLQQAQAVYLKPSLRILAESRLETPLLLGLYNGVKRRLVVTSPSPAVGGPVQGDNRPLNGDQQAQPQ